jgi:hypothetical protein
LYYQSIDDFGMDAFLDKMSVDDAGRFERGYL